MPITQDRLDTLLREHEDVLSRVLNARGMLESLVRRDGIDWPERKELLLAALRDLANMPDKWAIVERERMKARWSRNVRMKEKMKGKRRLRGIPERASHAGITPTPREVDITSDAEYEAWNRGEIE